MLKSGDLVKVFPDDAPEFETATVEYVGPVLVEVTGGRWFFLHDGRSLDASAMVHIEPTNDLQLRIQFVSMISPAADISTS
jgi:hypothetical protein